eukprot:TRINITY_DN10480_c0_g1_i1.p1 TRINITY_DN10480_c0_g1~~TRINITY_DN10480_c0_g1_i1.p1  ORF type:complete len:850 (+),score=138.72 TRINITY_DN10480_c0_g1_i1:111-2660(+)
MEDEARNRANVEAPGLHLRTTSNSITDRVNAFRERQRNLMRHFEVEEEEKDICRVCRAGDSPEKPLFYPCRCSGSIKYIHEDCLLKWLEHSKTRSCELCKTPYSFTKVYAPETPQGLPIQDILVGAFKRMFRFSKSAFRIMAVLIVWGIFVPIVTSWLWKFYFGSFKSTFQDFSTVIRTFEWKTLLLDVAFGVVISGTIVILLLGLSSLLEYMQLRAEFNPFGENLENQENDDIPEIEPPNENIVQPQQPQDVELEEFVGLVGPFPALIEKSILVLACFAGFLGMVILVPKTVGKIAILFLGKTANLEVLPPEIEENSKKYFSNEYDILTVSIGYGVFLFLGIVWLGISFLKQRRRPDTNPITKMIRFIFTFIKVAVIIVLEGGLFPFMAGWLIQTGLRGSVVRIDIQSEEGTTVTFSEQFPLISILIRWALGLAYMFNFACCISWLRGKLRDGVLWFFKNPNDPNFDPMKEMIEVPIVKHIRGMTLSAIMYTFMIITLIWGPLFLVTKIFPGFLPLNIWNREVWEFPLDLVSIHFLLPISLEYGSPTETMQNFTFLWLKSVGRMLGLTSYLFESDPTQMVKPPQFGFRIALLLILGHFTLFFWGLLFLVVPVTVGRKLFRIIGISAGSDLYSFMIGFSLVWISYLSVKHVIRVLHSRNWTHISGQLHKFSIIAIKWLLLGSMWLGVMPLLIGLALDLSFLMPIRVSVYESPNFILYQDWTLGLMIEHVFFRNLTLINDNWMAKFQRVKTNGISGVKLRETFSEIMFPILEPLLFSLIMPFLVVRGILPFFTSSLVILSGSFRWCYFVFYMAFFVHFMSNLLLKWLPRFKQAIIDDKYLIGHRLHNFRQ